MRGGSDFNFESVDLLRYILNKTELKRGGSYIKSPKWIKNKEATIIPQNYCDNNCFQYSVIDSLDHQSIGTNPERISNIKSFIDKYN